MKVVGHLRLERSDMEEEPPTRLELEEELLEKLRTLVMIKFLR